MKPKKQRYEHPNGTTRALGLTPLEWDILSHRLGEPSCITDVFGPDGNDVYAPEDVEVVVSDLWNGNFDASIGVSPLMTKDILADCVDGNTYLIDIDEGVASGDLSESSARRRIKAGDSLADKVSAVHRPACGDRPIMTKEHKQQTKTFIVGGILAIIVLVLIHTSESSNEARRVQQTRDTK